MESDAILYLSDMGDYMMLYGTANLKRESLPCKQGRLFVVRDSVLFRFQLQLLRPGAGQKVIFAFPEQRKQFFLRPDRKAGDLRPER